MATMNDWIAVAERIVAAANPDRVLAIGPRARDVVAPLAERRPDVRITAAPDVDGEDPARALHGLGRFDFAVAAGVLERIGIGAGRVLIGRVRDLHAPRMLIAYDHAVEGGWTLADFIALGLTRIGAGAATSGDTTLYGFDIASYKATPDWLNARHWANPERWDKARW